VTPFGTPNSRTSFEFSACAVRFVSAHRTLILALGMLHAAALADTERRAPTKGPSRVVACRESLPRGGRWRAARVV